MVRHDRTAVVMSRKLAAQFHKKAGDIFTVISPDTPRADGTKNWTFKIAAIGEESSQNTGGYVIGNYDYFDKSLPLAEQRQDQRGGFCGRRSGAAPTALAEQIDRLFANSGNPTSSQPKRRALPSATIGAAWM